jgi:hypothetical protein
VVAVELLLDMRLELQVAVVPQETLETSAEQ